ncbi:MAG: hypothetical protein OXG15_00385 [Gammaproteobacteria bacterium]|nr:hypothetical protein [Gammaproteobacteria bacterium]
MKRFLLRHYLAHLDTLPAKQRHQVITTLQRPEPSSAVPHQIP